jgi:hypothetical protein
MNLRILNLKGILGDLNPKGGDDEREMFILK